MRALVQNGYRGPGVLAPEDVAGIVDAVGSDVTTFQVGDAVYGDLSGDRFGGFAEFVRVAAGHLVHKPAAMSFGQAAALPHAGELALQGIAACPALRPGMTVLVNGAGGGVGTLAVQLLRPYGVETTGVDLAEKHDLLRALGYDHVIEYPAVDFTRTGKRYDFVLDVKTTLPARHYLRALEPEGTMRRSAASS